MQRQLPLLRRCARDSHLLLGKHGQQQVRRVVCVVEDLVQHRLARADVVGDVFGERLPGHPFRQIQAGYLEADPVPLS